MEIELNTVPKSNAIIVAGFPGFGFVATIAAEFLLEHLDCKSIGRLWSDELTPMAFIRKSKIMQPLEIFYNEKYNLVIIEAFSGINGLEWELAESLLTLAKKINAKEIISFEGLQSMDDDEAPESYYLTNVAGTKAKLVKLGLKPMQEGIVVGVTGALMLKDKDAKTSFIFATTHSKLPDSRAAAKLIEVFGKYMGVTLDIKPLLKKAEEVEVKLKDILEQAKRTVGSKQRKDAMEYIS